MQAIIELIQRNILLRKIFLFSENFELLFETKKSINLIFCALVHNYDLAIFYNNIFFLQIALIHRVPFNKKEKFFKLPVIFS